MNTAFHFVNQTQQINIRKQHPFAKTHFKVQGFETQGKLMPFKIK